MFDLNNLREKAKSTLAKARERFTPMAESAKQKSDRAAEKVAGKMSEWTGKAVTPGYVKKVAVIGAAIAIGLHVLSGMGGAGGQVAEGGRQSGSGHYEGFDDSFEGQTSGFFADKGGLNIETHTVDVDGVVLD